MDDKYLEQFDSVLLIEEEIDEAKATKYTSTGTLDTRMKARPWIAPQEVVNPITTLGPGAVVSYGSMIRGSLPQGNGFSSELVDFGDAIVVRVNYTNIRSAKSTSQTFLILFTTRAGSCLVKSSNVRWRTCNSPDQAVSYIRSRTSGLASKTTSID